MQPKTGSEYNAGRKAGLYAAFTDTVNTVVTRGKGEYLDWLTSRSLKGPILSTVTSIGL